MCPLLHRLLLLLLFSALCIPLAAQAGHSYPVLPATGDSIADFRPDGWKIMKTATGDLNGDGQKDIVFIIESEADYSYPDDNDRGRGRWFNLRILGIAFWNKATRQYELHLQSNDFVATLESDPAMTEPFGGMWIKGRALYFSFFWWFGSGTWFMGNNLFVFRYDGQDNQFHLTQYESGKVHRASHAETKLTADYRSGRGKLFVSEHKQDKGVTRRGRFLQTEPLTFDSVGNSLSFTGPEFVFDSW